MKFSRRKFLAATAIGSASAAFGLGAQEGKSASPQPEAAPRRPAMICKVTGVQAMDGAYEMLRRGHDTLDAALLVCRAQEDDPTDDSVGLGGLPNEDGVVELDACCMHGPTRRAGAVAGVRDVKNVSLLAKLVMERTDHLLLVGEGAEIGRAHV